MARRRRGDGSVFYSKSEGCWVARVSLGFRDGKRIRRRVRAGNERDARAELDNLLRAYRPGRDPATMTLDAYLSDWMTGKAREVRPATMTAYRGHVLLHITPLLGGIAVSRLQPNDVRRLIADRLRAGVTPATVGHIITTLRIALGVVHREGGINANPATAVRLPRVDREPVRAMSPDEAKAIVRGVADGPLGPLYLLLLGSGMRLGEALRLDWRDVGPDTVSIRHGKTRRSVRTIPVAAFALAALPPRGKDDEPVFLGPRTGKRLTQPTVSHHFPRLLARVGLPRMRVHDLRHGHATLLLAAGTPMRVIADQLGHANPSMTANVYAHVTEAMSRSAIANLDAIMGPQMGPDNG